MSIVFMGTPAFATTILKKLVDEGVAITAVITAPDRKSGRGQKINKNDVKIYAEEQGLSILQPTNLKDPEFTVKLQALHADLFVVVAFRMLPETVWSIPQKGTINLHASLLPNYRGAAPINWAIINGEISTGVTTFFIEKEIDTGMIIEQKKLTIGENESAGELHDRLMELGANVVHSTLEKINANELTPVSKETLMHTALKSAPKIFKSNCQINFSKDVQTVHNFCRGLSPYPASWCTLYNKDKNEQKTYKLFSTEKTNKTIANDKQLLASDEGILFPCTDYYLLVKEIQPEGKRKMHFKDFLTGNSIEKLSLAISDEV